MAINEVMGLTLELEANTDKFVKDLQDAATGLNVGFDTAGLVKSFGSAQKDIKGMFAKTVADAATLGFSRTNIDKLTKKLSPLKDSIESSMKAVFDAQLKVRKAQRDNLHEDIIKQHKAVLADEEVKLQALSNRYDFEKKATDRLMDRRKSAVQEAERLAARTRGEAAEEFGKGIADAFSNLKGGDIGSVLKKLGKGVGGRGAGLEAKGAAQGGGVGKLTATMGKLLAGLGPILIGIGALAAGIAAIVGIMMGADSAMKELNKTMFNSGLAAGDLDDGVGSLGDTVDRVRKTFTASEGAFSFNRLWGTTAKDHLEILGAYAKAGLTFREITAGVRTAADEMERLREATSTALAYSKLLGTSSVEMAEVFATRMEELHTDIDGVQQSLSAVHMAAKESGFGVKRFFNMVLQATSGMSMYNVRMEEAAGLLLRLGGILGSKMGGDFLANLTKGFGQESTQDKYKRVMTTGAGRTKATYGRTASRTAAKFVKDLDEKKLGARFAEAASDAGLTVNFKDSKQLVKDLGKLSRDDQTKLLAEARLAGDDAMVTGLTNLIMTTQGAKGGVGNMAMNLGGLDMGGKLMMQLQQGMALGLGPIHEMTLKQTMAFESITGVSGEQLEQLKRISGGMTGNYNKLRELEKQDKAGTLYAGKTTLEVMKMKEEQVKAYGAYVEGGQAMLAKLDANQAIDKDNAIALGETFGDYVQSQGDVIAKAAKEGVPADIKLAQEMVKQTTDLGTIMKQGVEYWLERIYGVTQSLMNLLVKGGNKEARMAALAELGKRIEEKRALAMAKEMEGNAKLAEYKAATTPADRKRLKEELAVLRGEEAAAKEALRLTDEQRRRIFETPEAVQYAWSDENSKQGIMNRAAGDNDSQWVKQEYGKTPQELAPQIVAPLLAAVKEQSDARISEKAVDLMIYKRLRSSGRGVADMDTHEIMADRMTFGEAQEVARMKSGDFQTAKSESPLMLAEYKDALKEVEAKADLEAQFMQDAISKMGSRIAERTLLGLPMDAAFTDQITRSATGFANLSHTSLGASTTYTDEDGKKHEIKLTKEMANTLKGVLESSKTKPVVEKLQKEAAARKLEGWTRVGGPGPKAAALTQVAEDRKLLREMEVTKAGNKLANIFSEMGVAKSSDDILKMADQLVGENGAAPEGAFTKAELDKVVVKGDETKGTQDKTLKELLGADDLWNSPRKANDFLMQIGQGGRVKFAQRIDTSDQVDVAAHKPGGPMSRSGKGGSGVVINSFGNSAEVIRGIQAAVAAGVV
jgi:hypothetical protein